MAEDATLRRAVWVSGLVLALLLAGCGGDAQSDRESDEGPRTPAASGPLVVDGVVDETQLAARRDAFEALDEDAQQQQANDASGALERELYAVSGLTEALGGEDAVETSIAETAQWAAGLADDAAAMQAKPLARVAPGAAVPAAALPEATTFGEGLFGGLLVAMLSADSAIGLTNDGRVGEDSRPGATIKATKDSVDLETTASFTDSTGVTTDLKVRVVAAPCPLPDGSFTASAHVEVASTTGGGRTGKRATFDVAIAGTVGDKAELVGYDTEYRGQFADFKANRGGYAEVSGAWARDGGGTFGVTRTGGAATPELVENASGLSTLVTILVAQKLADAAKKGWESGRCVSLKPTVSAGPSQLKPSTVVQIVAAPRSKMDGGSVGGTVAAVLSGQTSISPDSAPADATFTYTAPPKREMRATVALEARSRRGVAKATVELDTWQPAYAVSGGGEVRFSGTVHSIVGSFLLEGTFIGGDAIFRFDGAREDGGSVEVDGSGSGATLTGGGTYTLTERDDGVVLVKARVRTCVDVSKVCRTTTHNITLTPKR